MICLGIFSLESSQTDNQLSLAKLILATQLPQQTAEPDQAPANADNLSANSDSEPIITLAKSSDNQKFLQDLNNHSVSTLQDESKEDQSKKNKQKQNEPDSQFSRIKAISKPIPPLNPKAEVLWSNPVNDIMSFVDSDSATGTVQSASHNDNSTSLQSLKIRSMKDKIR